VPIRPVLLAYVQAGCTIETEPIVLTAETTDWSSAESASFIDFVKNYVKLRVTKMRW